MPNDQKNLIGSKTKPPKQNPNQEKNPKRVKKKKKKKTRNE